MHAASAVTLLRLFVRFCRDVWPRSSSSSAGLRRSLRSTLSSPPRVRFSRSIQSPVGLSSRSLWSCTLAVGLHCSRAAASLHVPPPPLPVRSGRRHCFRLQQCDNASLTPSAASLHSLVSLRRFFPHLTLRSTLRLASPLSFALFAALTPLSLLTTARLSSRSRLSRCSSATGAAHLTPHHPLTSSITAPPNHTQPLLFFPDRRAPSLACPVFLCPSLLLTPQHDDHLATRPRAVSGCASVPSLSSWPYISTACCNQAQRAFRFERTCICGKHRTTSARECMQLCKER